MLAAQESGLLVGRLGSWATPIVVISRRSAELIGPRRLDLHMTAGTWGSSQWRRGRWAEEASHHDGRDAHEPPTHDQTWGSQRGVSSQRGRERRGRDVGGSCAAGGRASPRQTSEQRLQGASRGFKGHRRGIGPGWIRQVTSAWE